MITFLLVILVLAALKIMVGSHRANRRAEARYQQAMYNAESVEEMDWQLMQGGM